MSRTEGLPETGTVDREDERRRLQAAALGWSAAQADAMRWADMGALHYDGRVYYRQDDPARAKRGRTVARSRVEALMSAGFLRLNETDGRTVDLTRDGHAARRAWVAVRPQPAEQESTALLPLLFGELETRQRAEAAARAEQRAEREALTRRFTPDPAPAADVDPSACDHEPYVWLYLTADRITGRLGYHLACACGQERRAYAGNSPGMNTGTATRPLGIADAGTEVAVFHADRCGYGVTGRWQVLDDHTKRAPVAPAAEPLWPVVDDPNRRPEPTPAAAVDQAADDRPTPAESVTVAPVTETGEEDQADDEPADDSPCTHVARWLYVEAEQPTRQLRAYLTCGCGRGGRLGNFNQRTATLAAGRTVAAAQTRTAEALADRNNYQVTGAWETLDEHTKRAAVRWTRASAPAAAPAAETVTARPVTKPATAAAADKDQAHAAWLDRHAERTGMLTIDGPGIVGPGTHITYRDGRGPGMRSKHGNHGTVVRISGTQVTWRPYGCRRTLRAPLADMRVNVPGTSATADAHGEAAAWRRWSLADHLAYARRSAPPTAPQKPAQAPSGAQDATTPAEPLQLPLWPAQVTPGAAPVVPVTVTEQPVTQTTGRPASTANVVMPLRPAAGPVLVVPCSGAKLDHAAEAGELYTGSLYRAARKAADALAAAHGGTMWILSARHGFLSPRTVIEPYDQEWDKPGSISTDELRAQATRMGLHGAERVVLLTPAKYTARAVAVWPHATAELAGLDIFGQRHRLAQLADTAQAPAA